MAMEKRARFHSWWLPYALVAPQLAITAIFFFWPAAATIYYSVMLQDPFGTTMQFAGLENFSTLFHDPNYIESFKVTALFSFLIAVIGLSFSLLLAVFADRVLHGAAVYKTLLIWPYAVAPVIAGVLWLFLFNPTLGLVAYALRKLGIPWDPLLDGTHALILITVASVWKQVSYNFLFFLAGLQSIPRSLIEAAAIDGAGPVKRFVTIVFPLLSPTTFFLLVINIIYAFFETFAVVDAATSGGPGQATEILVYKVFKDGIKSLDLGGSAAQSAILMAIVITLTVLQFRYIERKVQY